MELKPAEAELLQYLVKQADPSQVPVRLHSALLTLLYATGKTQPRKTRGGKPGGPPLKDFIDEALVQAKWYTSRQIMQACKKAGWTSPLVDPLPAADQAIRGLATAGRLVKKKSGRSVFYRLPAKRRTTKRKAK
jgi:hypothetical protein